MVGVFCALIDILSAKALVYAGMYYGSAVTIGFLLGLVANYVLHAKITFKVASSHATMMKFGVVVAINYGFTLLLSYFSMQLTGDFLAGKLLSLPVVAANGFLLSKYWVFK
ncbi:GtrA family protein [Janthinobacterium sp. PSPC3-1]|uniref:GtrA family protein n=1 Tax=Janthinobacterium sp. PSPC3-1 TaxID=2804653 RepID=UPI003CE9ABCD